MKLKHIILLFVVQLILTSCEILNVEVKTVKGNWKSDITNGQYIFLNLEDNDTYSYKTILNDTTILIKQQGSWVLKNDTLSLYHQNFENKGIIRLSIEQISMNTLTLKNIPHGDVIVLHRLYSKNLDYNGRFEEVLELKGGFWWAAWIITLFIFSILSSIFIIYLIGVFVVDLIKRIRKKIRKN